MVDGPSWRAARKPCATMHVRGSLRYEELRGVRANGGIGTVRRCYGQHDQLVCALAAVRPACV